MSWINTNLILIALTLGTLFFASSPALAGKQVKVLGIGNSFTMNSNTFRQSLNDADPKNQLLLSIAYIGGCSLEKHLTLAQLHEKNPADPEGKPYDGKSLKEMLLSDKWDAVTIQQYSLISVDINSYRPYAKELCDYVKKYCPNAKIVVHETWAYRSDDPQFGPGKEQSVDMYCKLHAAYTQIASELGNLKVILTGTALQNALQRPDWNFQPDTKFDFQHATPPALPNQKYSLHAGWGWGKNSSGKPSLGYDGHHAGTAGEFLAALVWREFFLGVDVRKNTFKPQNLSEEEAAILRSVAHATVAEHLEPKCLKTPSTAPSKKK
jgi:hypothetical protein